MSSTSLSGVMGFTRLPRPVSVLSSMVVAASRTTPRSPSRRTRTWLSDRCSGAEELPAVDAEVVAAHVLLLSSMVLADVGREGRRACPRGVLRRAAAYGSTPAPGPVNSTQLRLPKPVVGPAGDRPEHQVQPLRTREVERERLAGVGVVVARRSTSSVDRRERAARSGCRGGSRPPPRLPAALVAAPPAKRNVICLSMFVEVDAVVERDPVARIEARRGSGRRRIGRWRRRCRWSCRTPPGRTRPAGG